MGVEEALRRTGGRATAGELRALGVPRRALARALHDGTVVRTRRGHYRLAALSDQLDVAVSLTAALSHRSAALHHGLQVGTAPELPEVVVRRNRRLDPGQQARAAVRWRPVEPAELRAGTTGLIRTVVDCARDLSLPEALAVADSALRRTDVSPQDLREAAAALRGPGCRQAREVALRARATAANPFESCLRALALLAGLDVEPQVQITGPSLFAQVDLADEGRRLVIEAESFTHHAHRRGFRKDLQRYTDLGVHGWTVLRFSWEDVMLRPERVLWALRSWREARDEGRPVGHPPRAVRAGVQIGA
ncbi:hypothetical protein SGUI_1735 [Serinicoccus hydrothermalis]|uniref:Uncharacterized protein n=1 Tax=Serinicoccus hydrothermalis TaxID=1758689 RepID=A0A1B1NCL8_9MICO|nr:type IV toxin-antitoxin system AbiEi family antitoxin domain-containing protein [Serinicoccus hydrothermalis]ANS79131.1 hypothetical protein SGUI_1735 [Serinicoccus hydrothermalis]